MDDIGNAGGTAATGTAGAATAATAATGTAGAQPAQPQAEQAQGVAQAQAPGATAAQAQAPAGQQAAQPGAQSPGQPAPVQRTAAQAQDLSPDWKASLPDALRAEAQAFASAEEMKDALKRGASYRPALDPAELECQLDGVEIDPEQNKAFRELGVKIGLTKEQAAALMEFEWKSVSASLRKEREDGIARLRTQWADKYEGNVQQAERAMLALDAKMQGRLSAAFGKGGVASSPVLLEAFAHVGKGMAEDSGPGQASAASARETPLATYERMFH